MVYRMFRSEILLVVGVSRVIVLESSRVDQAELGPSVVPAAERDDRDERKLRDLRHNVLFNAVA